MATLTVDKPSAEAIKTQVLDAVEEAKRAIARGKHQLEDLKENTTYRIRRAPLTSVGIGFGAGLLLGAGIALIAVTTAKKS